MQSYSLFELNNYIRQVIALNFEDAVWVNCEISQIRESRGQVYLELIEQNEDKTDIVASNGAIIWYKTVLFLKKKLGLIYKSILQDGTQVLLKIKVDYHERFGLKLQILDIDPAYTLGQVELQRQQILARLKDNGLLGLNKQVSMPCVLQRIAVISSENAAGYQDFVHQLEHNIYGYDFQRILFHTAVQGQKVEQEVCTAIDEITQNATSYDCIVIIRGGGSRLDLAGFDNFNIGYKISQCPIPVFTGIGHEIDSSIADIVAHTPLKTPTAVADFLIEHNMSFESFLDQNAIRIEQIVSDRVQVIERNMDTLQTQLYKQVTNILTNKNAALDIHREQIVYASHRLITKRESDLEVAEKVVEMSSLQTTLKRGFAIVRQANHIIKQSTGLKDEPIEIEFQDGKIIR